jgi:3-oxoacyl-[acyl-carrier-protein] synthase III
MATCSVAGVRVAGIASAVPDRIRTLAAEAAVFGEAEVARVSESIGVRSRHVVFDGMCASDLCFAAADRLLGDLGWARESVDALIFVSQTPDYRLPATSCDLQRRLRLPKTCAAFDVGLGCSGHVYGLWIASSLVSAGGARRVLVLTGDASTYFCSPLDRSVALLFGDAGTATAIEADAAASPMTFVLGTDGGGRDNLIVPAGGFRTPHSAATSTRVAGDDGNSRSAEDLFMNGAEIFAFTLREVPPLVNAVLQGAGWTVDEVEAFVFHQANQFMLQHLAKRLKLPRDRFVLAMEEFGNTSSASVPLAISARLGPALRGRPLRMVLAGFGVGYSWAAVALTCGPMVMPDVLGVSAGAIGAMSPEAV